MARRAAPSCLEAFTKTSCALVFSLIGPGRVEVGAARPVFTVARIAPRILSRWALTSASLLPETDVSLAIASCASEILFFLQCSSTCAIVA